MIGVEPADERTRSQKEDGLPHVTDILRDVGIISGNPSQSVGQRGKGVHKACEMDDLGELNEANLKEEERPFFMAYRKFKREKEITRTASEELIESKTYGFCGRLDWRGALVMRGSLRLALIDFKSGSIAPSTPLQLEAYAIASVDERPETTGSPSDYLLLALRLGADGAYSLVEFKNRRLYRNTFLGAVAVYNWKHRR